MHRSSTGESVLVPASPESVPRARHWVLERARRAGASPLSLAAVELAASEVITNAVRHAAGTVDVVIRVRAGTREVTVEVEDDDVRPPTLQADRAGLPGGRGLRVVQAVTADWGWRPRPEPGKVVWFVVRW